MEVAAVNCAGSRANYVNEDKKSSRAGKAFASSLVPGLGQICDGRVGTGVAYLAGTLAANIGAIKLYTGRRNEIKKYVDHITKDCSHEQAMKIMDIKFKMANSKTKCAYQKFVDDLIKVMGKKANPDVVKSLTEFWARTNPKLVGAGLLGLATVGLWLANVIDAGKAHKEV